MGLGISELSQRVTGRPGRYRIVKKCLEVPLRGGSSERSMSPTGGDSQPNGIQKGPPKVDPPGTVPEYSTGD